MQAPQQTPGADSRRVGLSLRTWASVGEHPRSRAATGEYVHGGEHDAVSLDERTHQ